MNVCRTQFGRIIELDRLIRAGKYPNCSSFAKVWEVSTKTVQRDIEFLKNNNAPIEYDKIKRGYYYTDHSWTLPMMNLTESEILQLLMAESMAKLFNGTPIAESLNSLFDKLQMVLQDKITVDPVIFGNHFSFHGQAKRPINEKIWLSLFKALRNNLLIHFWYMTPNMDKPKYRTFEPLHLACIGEEWYLFGYDLDNEELRTFALSRIQSVDLSEKVFEPKPFDPVVFFSNRFGRFIGKPGEEYNIKIRFSPEIAPWVLERIWHPQQKDEYDKDGFLILSLPVPSLYEAKGWVLQWGEEAEVLAPDELRQEIRETVRSLANSIYSN